MKLKKKAVLLLPLLVALPFVAIWAKRAFHERWSAIPAQGGRPFTMAPILTPHYLQKDDQWKDETIGGTRERLARVGCAVCSLAMALDHYGIQASPKELNDFLKNNGGYTLRGWLKWNAIDRFSGGKVVMAYIGSPNSGRIDEALTNSDPVIVKVYINGVIPHWVLLVGKSNNDYLMRDPLDDTRQIKALAAYGSRIYAMRVLKSAQRTSPTLAAKIHSSEANYEFDRPLRLLVRRF